MSDQPDDTVSMWAKMLGLGPLISMASSPDFQRQIAAFVNAIADTQARCQRIEHKLDFLISLTSGQEGSELDKEGRELAKSAFLNRPALLAQSGTDGDRGLTASSGVAHDGTRASKKRA